MADIGKQRTEMALAALGRIIGEALEGKSSLIIIHAPRHAVRIIARGRTQTLSLPKCIDDMIGLIKYDAKLNLKNKRRSQIGDLPILYRREFLMPLYIVVKVIRYKGSEEIRLHIA